MNHIFKKVWNRALGRVVVTSELAKTNVMASSGSVEKVDDFKNNEGVNNSV